MNISNQALARLSRSYRDRLSEARSAHANGRRVVGRVGHTIPLELILAAGCTPVMIAADPGRATPNADVYVDPELPRETRALCEAAMVGELEFLDLLVLSRNYDKLFYFMKEIYRLGRGPKFPPFMIYDLMQSRREAVRDYNYGRFAALADRHARIVPQPLGADALKDAIDLTNGVRALQRRLADLRYSGRISGVDAMQAIGAGFFMHPAEYARELDLFLRDSGSWPSNGARPRVLLATAEPLQHTSLHEALEEAGANVVAEDDAWGARATGADIVPGDNPLEAIFRKIWLDTPSPGVWPPPARENWLMREAARSDVDAVVLHMPPSDRLLGWDAPRISSTLRRDGKSVALLFQDVHRTDGRADLIREAREFLAALPARPSKETGR
jgi:benzoyl-CoA reductase/2-hydroxyglutaryl-CoA dehydratase subunit BcrC/BadD/HgdB